MPTTSWGLRYPASSAAPNVAQDIQNLASDVQTYSVPRFASVSARNAGLPSPVANQVAIVAGNTHVYDGSAWRFTLGNVAVVSTDGVTGTANISHGGGQTPVYVMLTPLDSGDTINKIIKWMVQSVSSTIIQVRAVRTDSSAYLLGNAGLNLYWEARF